MFSCEFCETIKNTFLTEHFQGNTSDFNNSNSFKIMNNWENNWNQIVKETKADLSKKRYLTYQIIISFKQY